MCILYGVLLSLIPLFLPGICMQNMARGGGW